MRLEGGGSMERKYTRPSAPRALALFGLVGCLVSSTAAVPAEAEKLASVFDGRSLKGWEGNPAYWSVKDGMIVGRLASAKWSTYLVTKKRYRNFRFLCSMREVVRNAHSGISYWGYVDPDNNWTYHGHLVVVPSPWGIWDLYGRSGLVEGTKTPAYRVGHEKEWNEIEILAIGDRVRVAVNGTLCIDFTDPEPWRLVRGPLGLQLHSGGPAEIEFKDLRISADPEDRMLTVR
jgi:3-keto-disaccharide hydrolase